jgi:hypothetical protein
MIAIHALQPAGYSIHLALLGQPFITTSDNFRFNSLDFYKYQGPDYRRPPIYLEYKITAVSVWPHLLQQRAPAVF